MYTVDFPKRTASWPQTNQLQRSPLVGGPGTRPLLLGRGRPLPQGPTLHTTRQRSYAFPALHPLPRLWEKLRSKFLSPSDENSKENLKGGPY